MVDQSSTFSLAARIFVRRYVIDILRRLHITLSNIPVVFTSPAFLCIAFWPGSFATDTVRFYIPGSFVLCGGIVRDSASWAGHIVIALIAHIAVVNVKICRCPVLL